MSPQFKNLKDMQKYLENVAPAILMDKRIEKVLRDNMRKAIRDVVYSSYTPKVYERRGFNGGLMDSAHMVITDAIMSGSKFKIIFQNITEGNDTLKGELLAETIEEGIGSNWSKQGVWSNPRPFNKETAEMIRANPQPLILAVKKAFISSGFKVK